MPSAFKQFFDPSGAMWERNKEIRDERARKLSDLMGSEAIAGESGLMQIGGPDSLITDIGDMIDPQEATGLYRSATAGQVEHLSQIQGALESGDPVLQQGAIKEYFDFIDPARTADQGPNSWQEYSYSTANPTRQGYSDWIDKRDKTRAGTDFDSSMPNPTLAKQFEYVEDGRPLTNETPSQIKALNAAGTIRYRPDSEAIGYQRAGLAIHTSMDSINAMISEILPGMEPIPEGLGPAQRVIARLGRWAKGKYDIEAVQGAQRHYATQSPLIAKLMSRSIFQDKGAGSDKDFELAQDFLPVLPGQALDNIGDDPEIMVMKMEAINYIVNTLYPRNLTHLNEADMAKVKITDPDSFSAKIQDYHDELMILEGKEVNRGDGNPKPGETFTMKDPATGEDVKMIVDSEGKGVRLL